MKLKILALAATLAFGATALQAKTFKWSSASDIATWDIHSQNNALQNGIHAAVYESFVDEAADAAHMAYDHNKPLIESMIACMDGSYARELLHDLSATPGE